ncbi:MAG TPA: hypothetical protein P5016_04900 [Verrucomicrobiales bacterium]|nr:hypothetical protein [Verrucomicrobiales bacterium]
MNRRQFLAATGAVGWCLPTGGAAEESGLVASIKKEVLWRNRDGTGTTWFHPRACLVDGEGGKPFVLMTLQSIRGSDFFGPVHWTRSHDLGKTWSDPVPVPSLGRVPMPGHEGLEKGVCDVVPQFHPKSNTTLAMGHVVFYRGLAFSRKDQLPRYPVYTVRRADGSWSEQQKLEWNDPRGSFIYSNNCGQRVTLPGGDILMAFTFGATEANRQVAGVRCGFDGATLTVQEVGPAISNSKGRGLLEPSITGFQNRIYLTIRAEDNRGYVCVSDDGLAYSEKKAWAWEDGEPLDLSTTQQHWLTHSEGLFLVYTRKESGNLKVPRWRSPLWMARVDPVKLCILRDSERVVLPLVGDGLLNPDEVALMGNFHTINASSSESWVTVGEWMPKREARGDTLLSRITWSRPNHLAVP